MTGRTAAESTLGSPGLRAVLVYRTGLALAKLALGKD